VTDPLPAILGHIIEGTVGGIVGAMTFYLLAHVLAWWVGWRAQQRDRKNPGTAQ